MKRLTAIIAFIVTMLCGAVAQTPLNMHVYFKTDSTNVQLSMEPMVGLVADYIKGHPDKLIIVAGYTSSNTPEAQREALCDKRAKAVEKMLVEKYKIDPEKLVSIGVGVSTRSDEPDFNEYVAFYTK